MTCTSPSLEKHICKYCAQQIEFVYHNTEDYDYYFCKKCNAHYGYSNGFRTSTKFFTSVDDKHYVIIITSYGTNICEMSNKFDITKRFYGVKNHIMSFESDKAPQFTPDNVNKKLKTILVFS